MRTLDIDPDIRRAQGPPPAWYRDAAPYQTVVDRVFSRTWHVIGHTSELDADGLVRPTTLLPGSLDEPIVLTRTEGRIAALANVCTHRGAILVDAPCAARVLTCPYHGRRFGLDGALRSMPGFDGVEGFPAPSDDLTRVPLFELGGTLLASAAPEVDLDGLVGPLLDRIGFAPLADMTPDPASDVDYELDANWALWMENYLEGFHVPWVHPSLARRLDLGGYRTELFDHLSVQVGLVDPTQPALDLPPGHPWQGQRIGGIYAALFPCTTLNLYPWGVSLNLVQPLGPTRTRIRYRALLWRPELRDAGPGASLGDVEAEDQAIVARVARGVRSRWARRARYSPTHEAGVHHFHRLLAAYLTDDAA